jgi:uncharacterized membrane protein
VEAYAGEWLQLLLRWVHLITGIAWIGASFYFVWLDNSLLPPRDPADAAQGIGGELWAVHGGGFYHVEKFRVAPATLPAPLHWFKWEAYSTWLSGFALFAVVYWWHADVWLVDRTVAALTPLQAIGISAGALAGGWLVYDQLCRRLGQDREALLAAATIALVALATYGLAQLFPGRALFLLVGAMLGTIMAANVLFVIIPSQRELVAATARGAAPDPVHGRRGKQRSVHNNYFTLPVLFAMISGHYPATWSHPHAWLVLLALMLLAAYVRHFFNLRHRGRTVWAIPLTALAGLAAVAALLAPAAPTAGAAPPFAAVQAIVAARCMPCHAERPAQPGFAVAPKGILLDTPPRIRANAANIATQAVATRAMPIGNLTGMTDAERATLGAWIAAGAPER